MADQQLKKVEDLGELPSHIISDIQYVERLRLKVATGSADREDRDDIVIISRNIKASLRDLGYDPEEYERLRKEMVPESKEKGADREIA